MPTPEHQLAALEARLDAPGLAFLAEGGEHRTFALPGGDLLLRVPLDWPERSGGDGSGHLAEAELLRRLAGTTPLRLPRVVDVLPDVGGLVLERLPGTPALGLDPEQEPGLARVVAEELGAAHASLHLLDPAAFDDLLGTDDHSPAEWREETAEASATVRGVLGDRRAGQLEAFLGLAAPRPTARRLVCHNDLGLEHVLVSRTGGAEPVVTGVIDWSDAALADPAYDFGLLLRDLGPAGFERALSIYRTRLDLDEGLVDRAVFYARCTLIEDLAYGLDEGREAYRDAALAGWDRVFGEHTSPA